MKFSIPFKKSCAYCRTTKMDVVIEPFGGHLPGALVTCPSPAAVAAMDANVPADKAVLGILAEALTRHAVLLFRGSEDAAQPPTPPTPGEAVETACSTSIKPETLRKFYAVLHRAAGIGCRLPTKDRQRQPTQPPTCKVNLRGACFPNYPETNVLGHSDVVGKSPYLL